MLWTVCSDFAFGKGRDKRGGREARIIGCLQFFLPSWHVSSLLDRGYHFFFYGIVEDCCISGFVVWPFFLASYSHFRHFCSLDSCSPSRSSIFTSNRCTHSKSASSCQRWSQCLLHNTTSLDWSAAFWLRGEQLRRRGNGVATSTTRSSSFRGRKRVPQPPPWHMGDCWYRR